MLGVDCLKHLVHMFMIVTMQDEFGTALLQQNALHFPSAFCKRLASDLLCPGNGG